MSDLLVSDLEGKGGGALPSMNGLTYMLLGRLLVRPSLLLGSFLLLIPFLSRNRFITQFPDLVPTI